MCQIYKNENYVAIWTAIADQLMWGDRVGTYGSNTSEGSVNDCCTHYKCMQATMEAWYMQIKMKTKDRNEGKEKGSLI